jgi:glycosyltransferase involved in cell wall biosynthesis
LALDVAKAWQVRHPRSPLRFVFAGQGDWESIVANAGPARDIVHYAGVIKGRDRSALVGSAVAMLAPTRFIEPFGGAGVEGMLCGTPLVATDYGAYTETVVPGVTGYRCKVLDDFVMGIEYAHALPRRPIAARARALYSLEACAPKYDEAFDALVGEHVGVFGGVGFYADRRGRPERRTDPSPAVEVEAAE